MLANHQTGNVKVLFIAVAFLSVAIGIYVQSGSNTQAPKALPQFASTTILPTPRTLPDTTFTDHKGQIFGLAQFKDKWSILFFGFTNCPDICPSTMRILKEVKQRLSENGLWGGYQVVMVSVDPERDSQEKLAAYVPFFDSEFIGLTADVEATREFAKNVGVIFVKRESENNSEWYDVDHSASLILLNPQGQWAGAITAPHKTEQISNDLTKLAKYTNAGSAKISATAISPSVSLASTTATDSEHGTSVALEFSNAWISPAPPSAGALAAYFTVLNNTEQDITIVKSQGAGFQEAVIHSTETKDGLRQMQLIDELMIPAGQSVKLRPLGTHVMLLEPDVPVLPGNIRQITLISDTGQHYNVDVPMREQPQP